MMIVPVTITLAGTQTYSDEQLAAALSKHAGWSVVRKKWPVLWAGVHVVKSPCIAAMIESKAGCITVVAYVGTLVGALNPLAFILYKSEMMDHVNQVAGEIQRLVSTGGGTTAF
jgi:hypothetical protein